MANAVRPDTGPDTAGAAAITVRPELEGQPVAITEQDVRDYVKTHPHRHWDASSPEPTITSVELQTAAEAQELTGGYIDLPDDAQVFVITLDGRFVVVGPPMPNMNNVLVGDTGRIVVDARTGNVLNYNAANLKRVD